MSKKVLILGSKGLVGSSLNRHLSKDEEYEIITSTRKDTDLFKSAEVNELLKKSQPDFVINAAAKVGGIQANNIFRADFIYDNLSIQTNIIKGCFEAKINNLIFLGFTW